MDAATRHRLFDYRMAFDNPVSLWITVAVVGLLAATPLVVGLLRLGGVISAEHRRELMRRWLSWCVLAPLMLLPVLLGAAWFILSIGLLGLFSFHEFCGVVALTDRRTTWTVYAGILALTLATLDHWYDLFVALLPLTTGLIAALAILDDRPKGYVYRVALGVWGYLLCGAGPAHLGYMANDANYRPIVLLILLSVELNDVFAYCCGKLFGRRKLAPNTSPNKTLAGALGSLVLTSLLVAVCGRFVFAGTVLARPEHLVVLGLLISLLGQLGDLMLSSVKRDVGVKDTGQLIPGHGGLLDRFDSLLLVAPAVFHYVGYFRGFGLDQTMRIFSS